MAMTEKEKKKYRKSQEKDADKIEMVSKLAKRKKEGKYFPKNVDGTKATDYRAALNTFKVQKAFDRDLKKGGKDLDLISDTRLASKEGSMKTGGLTGGQKKLDKNNNNRIDAQDFKILKAEKAKGRGQGLQDQKMTPGKVKPVKAVLGIATMGLLGAKMLKDKKKNSMAVPGVGAAAAIAKKKKEILGKRKGGMFKGYSKVFETAAKAGQKNAGTSTIVGVKPNPKKPRKTYKSMEEMRKAKGFKMINGKQETAEQFNRRKARAARAAKVMSSSRIGKIALGIATAGIAAKEYLKSKSKKKKDEPKKKMGGGMMQKYAEGGPAARSPIAEQKRRMGQRKKKPGLLGSAGRGLPGKKKKETLGQAQYKTFRSELDTQFKKGQRLQKSYEGASPTIKADMEKRFKGAYKPGEMVSSSRRDTAKTFMRVGGSVTVKTKLGRNKPTKMY